jgi:sulfatase maturation enzyme AslB (radical SAM superfamily)|tara:strand:+ start:1172 stop:2110 length:939 start_codon:yes stop_codon:yes gene_type:complete
MLVVNTTEGIRKSNHAQAKTSYNNFKGWHCGAGLEFLWISSLGNVFGNVCRHSGQYGNVFTDFTLPTQPMICPAESCYCSADLNILKSKDIKDFKSIKHLVDFSAPTYSKEEMLSIQTHNPEFAINWNIGKRCNYDCSYCPPAVHDNFSPHLGIKSFKTAFDKIYKHANGQLLQITFTGGEPTVNPDYYDIVSYAVEHGTKVITNTNGTGSFSKLAKLQKAGGLHISVHTEFYQPEKLAKKIEKLSKIKQGYCTIKFMLSPGQLHTCKDFFDTLPQSNGNYNISIEPLVDKNNNNKILDYTEEELEFIRKKR